MLGKKGKREPIKGRDWLVTHGVILPLKRFAIGITDMVPPQQHRQQRGLEGRVMSGYFVVHDTYN